MLKTILIVLAVLLLLWLGLRWVRRRRESGQATEVERRFESTLERFRVEVDRFKLTRQGAVKVIMNHDHRIWTEVETLALQGPEDRESLRLRVHRYVHEIVPFFSPLSYYSIGQTIARLSLNLLYKIDFRPEEVAQLKKYSKERPRSIIYLMNHRSNVDYVLAAYVLAEKVALSFAVGEWARVWPLEYLFKSFGSYFLRRGFRDQLYHTVLRRYVQLVTKNGVTQALFPEGGLSRDGLFRAPKIGLLDSIISSKQDRTFVRELVFVPVAVNYDRVLEDRALVAELRDKKARVGKVSAGRHVLRILFRNVSKFSRKEIRKNGVASVRFGEPVSFDEWHETRGVDIFSLPKEERRQHIAEFTDEMMGHIARLLPATPLCLVARILLQRAPIDRAKLVEAVTAEMAALEEKGVELSYKERGAEWVLEGALQRFEIRSLIKTVNGAYEPEPAQIPVLRYYANSIEHHYGAEVPKVRPPRPVPAAAASA